MKTRRDFLAACIASPAVAICHAASEVKSKSHKPDELFGKPEQAQSGELRKVYDILIWCQVRTPPYDEWLTSIECCLFGEDGRIVGFCYKDRDVVHALRQGDPRDVDQAPVLMTTWCK